MGSTEHFPPSEAFGDSLQGPLPTLWEAFASSAAATPDALALACVHQAPGLFGFPNIALDDDAYRARPYLRWSFQTLRDGVLRLVAAWRTLGVQEGATLVTFVHNGAEFLLATWAAIAMGCNFMPISPRNLTNVQEVMHMVKTGLSISNGTRPVVLVGSEQLAGAIDEIELLPEALRIVVETESPIPGSTWTTFRSLMESTSSLQMSGEACLSILGPTPCATGGSILFTSGTTSLPKGVYHPYEKNMGRIAPHRTQREGHGSWRPGAKMACSMPNNHAMSWICVTGMLMSGTALIFPGPAFEPGLMLETLFVERATHTILVPTMVHALVAVKAASPRFGDQLLSSLENVMLGGTALTTEHVDLLISALGVRGVENLFGCTEGLLASSHCTADARTIADGHDISTGWPMPGYCMRIVNPETGQVVPRGVLGEIHASGPALLGEYIGGVGSDAWYKDSKGIVWYRTGDQARMDEQGKIFVTGRYKDLIIRSGENISPGAIEALLAGNDLLNPLLPQVVGVKDAIAGEVPIAVVRGKVTPEIKSVIQAEVVAHMGALYVPEDVISTEDLGLSDYPRTTSGKIQKTKLTALINEHLARLEQGDVNAVHRSSDEPQLTEVVSKIWSRAVGLDPSRIELDAPLSGFADSITVMRVREGIKRQMGKTLSLQDMLGAKTIRKQIEMLLAMEASASEGQSNAGKRPTPRRQGPPELEDMAHLAENPELLQSTKKLVTDTIARYGLAWEDVEDVIPAYDFNSIMSQTRLNEDWAWHFAMQATAKVKKAQFRNALEAVIMNNRILGSFMACGSTALRPCDAFHVVMKQTRRFFDIIMEDGGSLATVSALKELQRSPPRPEWVTFPGPLYRAMLFDVEETGGAGVLMSANHAVIDASMAQMIHDDLDKALATVTESPTTTAEAILTQLPPHVDYKPWADSYFNLRTSAEARSATRWHVKRLQSLPEHVRAGALFPAKPAASPTERRLAVGLEPVWFSFDVPDVHRLRREHPHITAPVLVKAAVALMNMHRTGCSAAVFGNLEASRSYFPFLPKAMLEHGGAVFEATDVSRPAYQMVFNLVELDRAGGETALEFLSRVQEDQTLLTKHAAAPLRAVIEGLHEVSPGAGELLPRILDTQHFNWVPGLGETGTDPHQHFKMVAAECRPTIGLVVSAGLGGKENQTVFLKVYGDGVHIGREEAVRLGEQVQAITKWLATTLNWETPVAGFVGSVEGL